MRVIGATCAPPTEAFSKASRSPAAMSTTPTNSRPEPTGQLRAQAWMPSTSSTSVSTSSGERPGRSHLLMNVITGMPRRRQTANSFFVCVSTPLAASSTITAQSAAVSVR